MKRNNNPSPKNEENQTENSQDIQCENKENEKDENNGNKDVDMKDTPNSTQNGLINHTEIDGGGDKKNGDDKSGDNESTEATTKEIEQIDDK